jgi:4-amino-4-deoxy-L-arabinose transferase-like glycosyltransferase
MAFGIDKKKVIKYLVVGLLAVVVLLAGYTWLVLTWSFSNGERVGVVQKFSHKGWVVKTWEGELLMVTDATAVMKPERFLFTVRNQATVDQINKYLGKRVSLTYEQHKGIPTSLFGETGNFVVGVKLVD